MHETRLSSIIFWRMSPPCSLAPPGTCCATATSPAPTPRPPADAAATVHIGIAVAAISALLVAFSGVGPKALTAGRLDASVAATFGNLAEVRYHWLTGAKADTTIPWHATCNRGAGTRNSAGAGDDWACTVTDLRASDGAAASVLDVTLKANGCYEVQSLPGAVGALYVNDDQGRAFINPLYAFDGCFGTP